MKATVACLRVIAYLLAHVLELAVLRVLREPTGAIASCFATFIHIPQQIYLWHPLVVALAEMLCVA